VGAGHSLAGRCPGDLLIAAGAVGEQDDVEVAVAGSERDADLVAERARINPAWWAEPVGLAFLIDAEARVELFDRGR
jgi:hypothetical protein